MAMNDLALRDDLMSDYAAATNQSGQSQQALGIQADDSIQPVAQNMFGRSYAEAQFKKAKRQQSKLIDRLVETSSLVDQNELDKYRFQLNRDFNDLSIRIMQNEGDLKKALAKRGYDRKTQLAMTRAAGQLTGLGAQQLFSGGSSGGSYDAGPGRQAGPDNTMTSDI